MAKVRFQIKDIENYIKLNETILEKMNMFGTPVEKTDNEIEIEIFPNRPDLLSLQGFVRSFKTFIGKENGMKEYKLKKPADNYFVEIDPSVKEVRPYTACAVVKDLKFDDAKIKNIIDLQEKLHATIGRNRKKLAIGIYPLEKIKLPIRYEARKPEDIVFIPLESDREMNALQILQKHTAGRAYANLLENYEKYPVFVDSNKKILSMPPIINSIETGKVVESTNDVFVECSGFDLNILKKTLNIIVTTLAEMGGTIYQMELRYGKDKIITPDFKPESIKISLENANKLLGLSLSEKDLERLLPKMEYSYSNKKVKIPPWRLDILHEVDVIEDIAIAYGFDNFIPQIPNVSTIGEESKESNRKSKIAEILIGLGFIELSSYHLIKDEEAKMIVPDQRIELENSKTEFKYLRNNLLIPCLRILSENKDNEYPQKIFEIGTVFSKEKESIKESESLIIASSPSNFTDIKRILDYITKMLEINFELKEINKKEMIEGRVASIIVENKNIGYIGDIHPETLREFNIKMPISLIEINIDSIISYPK